MSYKNEVEFMKEKSTSNLQFWCQGDGIGRHARLKIWWLHGCVGSSPIPGNRRYIVWSGNENSTFFYAKIPWYVKKYSYYFS